MHLFFVLTVAACAAGLVLADSSCSSIKPVENFDLAKFQGKWYEYSKYPNSAEGGATCGQGQYIPTKDGTFEIKFTHIADGKLNEILGTGELHPDAKGNGILRFNLPYGPAGSVEKYTTIVADIDYDNYVVLVYCKSDKVFSWILSRSSELPAGPKAALEASIKSSKVLDSKLYVTTNLSEEACKY